VTSPASSPVLEARALTKVFKDFWLRPRVTAVDALDLEVRAHEVFGLLGPNGSGKSTTIKLALGLLFPTRGRIAVFGKPPSDVAIKRRIGYLPEESYLYRFLNPVETLDFYARLFHQHRATRRRRIDMLLDMVGLQGVRRRPVGEFSKGMQRRVGLAQALINDPDLLILDEPTTGLDPIGTQQIKDIILELRRRGKTVVLSSHLLADVEDVCDRLCVLYGGKVRAQGTVDELLTVQDTTVIETEALGDQAADRVEQAIERETGRKVRRVARQRKKLQTLFLEIVAAAQAQGATTSGATGGGPMAAFLAGEPSEGDELIDRLVRAGAAPRPVAAPSPAAPQPARDTAMIDQLVRGQAPPSPTAPPPAPPPPATPEDRSVIDSLLDKGPRS
jgi:ABC-2 type transport system ATP-binding protein